MASVYRVWSSIFFVAVVAQVALAGYGAFHVVKKAEDSGSVTKKAVEHGFSPHGALGFLIILASLIFLILAFPARRHYAFNTRKWTGGLFVLTVLQFVLPELGRQAPALGVLHPIDALAIYALSGLIAHRAWTTGSAPRAEGPAATGA